MYEFVTVTTDSQSCVTCRLDLRVAHNAGRHVNLYHSTSRCTTHRHIYATYIYHIAAVHATRSHFKLNWRTRAHTSSHFRLNVFLVCVVCLFNYITMAAELHTKRLHTWTSDDYKNERKTTIYMNTRRQYTRIQND